MPPSGFWERHSLPKCPTVHSREVCQTRATRRCKSDPRSSICQTNDRKIKPSKGQAIICHYKLDSAVSLFEELPLIKGSKPARVAMMHQVTIGGLHATDFSEYFQPTAFLGSQDDMYPANKPEFHASAVSPVLDERAHAAQLAEGPRIATKFGRVNVVGPRTLRDAVNGVYSLAQWQSGFKTQNDRGTCWAFAGDAALEMCASRRSGNGDPASNGSASTV